MCKCVLCFGSGPCRADDGGGGGAYVGGVGEGKIRCRKALDKSFMMTSRLWTNKNRQKKTKSVTIAFVALRYANVCDEVSSIWRAGGNWGKWHVVLGHKATITMRRSERQPGTIWHVAERPTPPGTSVYPTGPPARSTQRSLSVRRTGQEIKSHTRRHARSHTYTWWGRGLLRHSRKEKGGSQSAEVVQCIQKRWELSASLGWLETGGRIRRRC